MTKHTLAIAFTLLLSCTAPAWAQSGMHNFELPADVNGDGKVQKTDAQLLIDALGQKYANPLVLLEEVSPGNYLDTTNNGRVNSGDLLAVYNHMLVNVPEPGSIVSASAALLVLGGYCWRGRKRKPKSA